VDETRENEVSVYGLDVNRQAQKRENELKQNPPEWRPFIQGSSQKKLFQMPRAACQQKTPDRIIALWHSECISRGKMIRYKASGLIVNTKNLENHAAKPQADCERGKTKNVCFARNWVTQGGIPPLGERNIIHFTERTQRKIHEKGCAPADALSAKG
jgi:hypothetical protein